MGKKNKGKAAKKGQGQAKTESKTLKKDEKKTKKMLADAGEDDIETLIAKYKEEDRKRVEVIETKCPPPSPRVNMSLTAHPDKDELLMFGGEFYNGSKTFVYNDLFVYNCKKNEWTQVSSPNQPPPRCAHQAVALRQGGGQLWVFGGEFVSPSQLQFYHYKELWVLHLKTKQWEKISAAGGPSARSGHRMVAVKKQLIVFGGFHDNTRHYKYYNDLYSFNLETYTWSQLNVTGSLPSPRSGCIFLCGNDDSILLYGGYSKVTVKKDVDKGTVHTDMFLLVPAGKKEENSDKWKWSLVRQSGSKPSPRSGMGGCVVSTNRAILFGGVQDKELDDDDDDDMEGNFFNTMYTLETDRGKWHETQLRGKRDETASRKRRKRRESAGENADVMDESDDDDVEQTEEHIKKLKIDPQVTMDTTEQTTYDDGVFNVTVGPSVVTSSSHEESVIPELFMPPKRMNTSLVVQQGLLYLYGGSVEDGDRELTRTDMYCLDVKKLDEWKKLREDESGAQEWAESESEEEKEDEATGGKESESESDSEDDDDDPPPDVDEGESMEDYYARTRTTFWIPLTRADLAEEGKTDVSETKIEKIARKMAEMFYKS